MRAFLRSISPYRNVSATQEYPEIYLYTSTKDDRVHPGHARKMLHLLSDLRHDYLYFENIDGGHAAAGKIPCTLLRKLSRIRVITIADRPRVTLGPVPASNG